MVRRDRTQMVRGKRLFLDKLSDTDASVTYMGWLNDPLTNQFLESRYSSATLESLSGFIETCNGDPDLHLFGIFELESGRHVGNIKLGPVDTKHHHGDIGLIIGEKDCWGKGYATEAIQLICEFAFLTLKLHKVTASMYAENTNSYKAFIKAGFNREGLLRQHMWLEDHYSDKILMGKLYR